MVGRLNVDIAADALQLKDVAMGHGNHVLAFDGL